MKIRKANIKDLNTIVSLKIKMFEESNLDYLLADNCENIIYEKYIELYKNNMAQHFLYTIDGKIVGTAGGFIKEEIPYCFYKDNKYGFIGDMYTLSKYRRQGIAQELLTYTINWFKDNRINMIQLLASEDGLDLYNKNGFTINNDIMTLKIKEKK